MARRAPAPPDYVAPLPYRGLSLGMHATNRSGETAGTLILAGLILQAIGVAVVLGFSLVILIVPILGGIGLGFAFLGGLWIILVYTYSYQRTRAGEYEAARTPTLVFAILSLVTLALISGVLYLIAYVKLGDAAETRPLPAAWGSAPTPPSPMSYGKRCVLCGTTSPPDATFCSSCGSRLG